MRIETHALIPSNFYFLKKTKMTSNNNNAIIASIKAIEQNVAAILKNTADINEKVARLEAQFNKQFGPSISEQEMAALTEDSHEAGKIYKSPSKRKKGAKVIF